MLASHCPSWNQCSQPAYKHLAPQVIHAAKLRLKQVLHVLPKSTPRAVHSFIYLVTINSFYLF